MRKPAQERQNIWDFNGVNRLHFAPDRQPCQHLITQL